MYTAMALVALTLSMTTSNVSPTPNWLDDYQVARARVVDAGKPMVVVVGSGQAGWREVVRDGGFDTDVTKLLADKFVCLYADTTTVRGRQLADALRVRHGVVISDKTGRSQAFNASGTVSRTELVAALTRYAGQPEITRTEFQTTTTTTAPAPVSGGVVVQPAPVAQPGMVVQPGAPVYTGPVGAPMGGGYAAGCCPTGGYGGYAMGGACCGGGYAMGGCGGGHKCCGLFGGMFGGWGGGWGGGGCGGGYSTGCGHGGGCCGGGKFGGMFGGWGGGCGGGWGHGGGCCH